MKHQNLNTIALSLSRIYHTPEAANIKSVMTKMAQIDGGAIAMSAVVDSSMRTHSLNSVFVIKMMWAMQQHCVPYPYEEQIKVAMTTPPIFFENADQIHKNSFREVLMTIISQSARAYFAANRGADEYETAAACADYVMQNFKKLSPIEIKHAFAWAVGKYDFKAYGALSVVFMQSILTQYQKSRNAFLSAYEDELNKPTELDKQRKESEAYAKGLAELLKLREDNTRYRFFHECPHHYVERFIAEGKITVTPQRKKELYSTAIRYAAAYMIDNAERLKKPSTVQFFKDSGIEPLPVPNFDVADANGRSMLRMIFDAKNAQSLLEAHKETAITFYSKLLYFDSIMPYAV